MTNIELERGNRLRTLRLMLGLTISEFSNLCGLGDSTVGQWEHGRGRGLSIKGAHKIISALRGHNIVCELQWIMEGKGAPPEYIGKQQPQISKKAIESYIEKQIEKEIQLFCQYTNQPVFTSITDNAMEPYLKIGDYVGGSQYFGEEIKLLHNQICILTLSSNQHLVRILKFDSKLNLTKLQALNNKTETPIILNPQIISAALLTRVWRPAIL